MIQLIGFIVVCLLVGFVGAVFTRETLATWYDTLQKPAWTPPGWLFGPLWTLLYIMMGLSAYFVWREMNSLITIPMMLFTLHLVCNGLWSYLFFRCKNIKAAFVDLILLWGLLLATLIVFMSYSKIAGLMLIPYLLWVTFAGILNLSILRLNISKINHQ